MPFVKFSQHSKQNFEQYIRILIFLVTFLATHNLETGDTSKVFLILCLAKMTIYFFTFNTSNLQNFTITRSGMSIMMRTFSSCCLFLAFKKIFIWNFYDIDLLQGLLTAIYLTNGYKIRKFPRTESQLKILYFFCDMCFCIFQRTFSSCCLFVLQWRVFSLENSSTAEEYGGGSNKDIVSDIEEGKPNPTEDFTIVKR